MRLRFTEKRGQPKETPPPQARSKFAADPAFGYKNLNPPNEAEARRRWTEEQIAASMREYLQRANPSEPRIRFVPESDLVSDQHLREQPQNSQSSQLTPKPQSLRTGQVDGKGMQ
jgi:hypothetical protein